MYIILFFIFLLFVSGILSFFLKKKLRLSSQIGSFGSIITISFLLILSIFNFSRHKDLTLSFSWQMPFGNFAVGIDPLSNFFIIITLFISLLAAFYSVSYMSPELIKKKTGAHWFLFNTLVASMIMVLIARNGLLFLISWEIMSLTPFFLVSLDDNKISARKAAFIYLIAANIGSAFLLLLFILLGGASANLDFSSFKPEISSGILFILALIGFGIKAGFLPFHVWLPEAHPEAPSHISAIMSAVMIKMGIYGILRIITFLGLPQAWWGVTLILIGIISSVGAILFAMAQKDLKRLLAYSSIENIGIIAIGLGIGLLGMSFMYYSVMIIGFLGAFLHIINHSLSKSLLFLNAGAVYHATGTRNMNELGGIIKKMPMTSFLFLIGSLSIIAVPPFNAFISEFMIYYASFQGIINLPKNETIIIIIAVVSLALTGGLSLACFSKAFGITFLGFARSDKSEKAHDPQKTMLYPMIVLAILCLIFGVAAPFIISFPLETIRSTFNLMPELISEEKTQILKPLSLVSVVIISLIALSFLLFFMLKKIRDKRQISETVTWDCGYIAPSATMQYTESSFIEPLMRLFNPILGVKTNFHPITDIFPVKSSFMLKTHDVFKRYFYEPFFNLFSLIFNIFRPIQHGRIHFYLLYIVSTLIILLFWKIR